MIGQFVAGLSDTGKKLFAGALVIVAVALFDRLLIGPTMSRMHSIDQEIAREESGIKQDLHFLSYKNKILKESEALSPYLTVELPKEEEIIAAFLKKLEMLASKGNVTIIKITPSPGTQEKDYWKYTADLECSGKLPDVISFMHLINSSNDLMKVAKFNVAAKKDNEDLKVAMTVDKVVVGKRPMPALKVSMEADANSDSGSSASSSSGK